MTENFYDDIFYYSPSYYPGYKLNKKQNQKHLSYYPYIINEPKSTLDLQVFYNTTDDNTIPWGSSYKYTIPSSVDGNITSNHNSISERQKRFRRERFGNLNQKTNKNYLLYIILFFVILCFVCSFVALD
jgi:hypothetical protein